VRNGEHVVYVERQGHWEPWVSHLSLGDALRVATDLMNGNTFPAAARVECRRRIVRQFIRDKKGGWS
jgi:hypothetical protein